jgi:hypothetical protein
MSHNSMGLHSDSNTFIFSFYTSACWVTGMNTRITLARREIKPIELLEEVKKGDIYCSVTLQCIYKTELLLLIWYSTKWFWSQENRRPWNPLVCCAVQGLDEMLCNISNQDLVAVSEGRLFETGNLLIWGCDADTSADLHFDSFSILHIGEVLL